MSKFISTNRETVNGKSARKAMEGVEPTHGFGPSLLNWMMGLLAARWCAKYQHSLA
jgi:hypothetical protein